MVTRWSRKQLSNAQDASHTPHREDDDEDLRHQRRMADLPLFDPTKLNSEGKKLLLDNIVGSVELDNEMFLKRLRHRTDRVGIKIPRIEVRYENLSVEGDAVVGSTAFPTSFNASIFGFIGRSPTKKRVVNILKNVSGILKPSRMTLLMGPPSSGKTTLLKSLAGRLDSNLRVQGGVTYCGHDLSEFVPETTAAYISQLDLHYGEMTVRETLDFSGRCLGVGTRHHLLLELLRRESEAGIKPDPAIDAFMTATAESGQPTSLITDYVLKILGLETCADLLIGDDMRRGISGGQKKRLTTGEMLVGPFQAFFMDEISCGLDSATTFQIIEFMRQMVHIMDMTMVISLLQPAPETFQLFDDIILLSEGQIVYHGPRENVLEFFEYVGFRCPERKNVADFLQEVTSTKDQEQYWYPKERDYHYVSVSKFVEQFSSFRVGEELFRNLAVPFDKATTHPAALSKTKYGISNRESFNACLEREWLLIKRNSFVFIFKTTQITIMAAIAFTVFLRTEMKPGEWAGAALFWGALFFSLLNMMFNGMAEQALTILRLPVFFKQRNIFYPAWAFALPYWLLRIPLSLVESSIWVALTYYTIGFAPAPNRFFKQYIAFFAVHQMAISLFRFIAAVGRTQLVANTLASFTILLVVVLGGFVISKAEIPSWISWLYYVNPMMYGQNAIAINEFLSERWNVPTNNPDEPHFGILLLKERGLFTTNTWFWISIAALFGFSLIFNILFVVALSYLSLDFSDKKNLPPSSHGQGSQPFSTEVSPLPETSSSMTTDQTGHEMVLPFRPLSLAFDKVNYYVDMPAEMKREGREDRLQLLQNASGAFRPGILTALVGVSGAGKTTLMDVLAGRKTGGYITGTITVSGYPKNQSTFARISGYCEQNDVHSPHVTVYESLLYSAWLRLPGEVKGGTRKNFVEQVMELIELTSLRTCLVGLPGIDGLSTEQRKRLTIAVELVANPSIIFMDEPTTGLDARAAAVVMRTVRNTVNCGRTVVCTIHQPSIDIFETFDELMLMKIGGRIIYSGPLGRHSHKLIEYFQDIQGVPQIQDGCNPATWMLELSSIASESELGIDFGEIYANSDLYRLNQEMIDELSTPIPGTSDLKFPTKFSQTFANQFKACFWKQHRSYWRNSEYNGIRIFMTILMGVMFGFIFWNKAKTIQTQQQLVNLLGAFYVAIFFLGAFNSHNVLPVVAVERTVLYRERAAGMYSELPHAFAQVSIETIYVAMQCLIYCVILYLMIGFEWKASKMLYFFYFIFTSFTYFSLYGMMLVALTPGHHIAAVVMSFFLSFWNLFSGFLIPRPLTPVWWRWYFWASPVAWTINGIVTSQIGDRKTIIEIPEISSIRLDEFLKEFMGYDDDHLLLVMFAHLGWVLLFFVVFAFGIKFINFQRR